VAPWAGKVYQILPCDWLPQQHATHQEERSLEFQDRTIWYQHGNWLLGLVYKIGKQQWKYSMCWDSRGQRINWDIGSLEKLHLKCTRSDINMEKEAKESNELLLDFTRQSWSRLSFLRKIVRTELVLVISQHKIFKLSIICQIASYVVSFRVSCKLYFKFVAWN